MQLDRIIQRTVQAIVWGTGAFLTVTALYAAVWFWWFIW